MTCCVLEVRTEGSWPPKMPVATLLRDTEPIKNFRHRISYFCPNPSKDCYFFLRIKANIFPMAYRPDTVCPFPCLTYLTSFLNTHSSLMALRPLWKYSHASMLFLLTESSFSDMYLSLPHLCIQRPSLSVILLKTESSSQIPTHSFLSPEYLSESNILCYILVYLPSPGYELHKQFLSVLFHATMTSISALLTMPKPLTVWITRNSGKFWDVGIPDHLTCLLRNLYTGQEATVRTGHGTTDWFQIGKGVGQGCILSPCLFNF